MDAWLAFSAENDARDADGVEAFILEQDPEIRDLLRDLIEGARTEDGEDAAFGELPPEPSAAALRRVAGYRIVRELGRGGMGTVFEAVELAAERRVALKILDRGLALTAAGLERFRREAAASARVKHPSIASLYAVGENDGVHWIAMELVDGDSLSERVARARSGHGQAIGAARAATWIAEIAEALAAAHGEGILHRDLKPTNIQIDEQSRARLIDFGLAKFLDKSQASLTAGFAGSLASQARSRTRAPNRCRVKPSSDRRATSGPSASCSTSASPCVALLSRTRPRD